MHQWVGGQADRFVGVPDRLGQARGARTEDEDRLVGGASPVYPQPGTAAGERVGRPVVEVGHPIRAEKSGQQGRGLAVGHRVHRLAQVEGVADFGCLPRRTEEDSRRPELTDGVDGDDELHAVGRHQGHTVAAGHPPGGQMAPEGVAQNVQIPERPPLIATPDRSAISEPERGSLQGFVDQGVCHRKPSSPI